MDVSRADSVVNRLWDVYKDSYSPFPASNIGVDEEQDLSINHTELRDNYWQKSLSRPIM